MLIAFLWTLLRVLLWVLIALVGLLLLLILLLLILPLDLKARLDADWTAPSWEEEMEGAVRWEASLRWGWGLFRATWAGENLHLTFSEIRFLGRRLQGSKKRERKPKKKEQKRSNRPWDWDLIQAIATEALRFLQRLWQDLGLRLNGDLTYGFADPSLTGWTEALRHGAGVRLPVHLTPVFVRPCLSGQAEAAGRLYGYQVAAGIWRGLKNPVIRSRIAERIRFKPLRYLIARGG